MEKILCAMMIVGASMASTPVRAADGCTVLLCLAGNWGRIEQCRPPVEEALRDVARGRGWPSCGMGGTSNAGNTYIAPERCPAQYITIVFVGDGGSPIATCPWAGVIDVAVEGAPWTRTWWSTSGDSVTEWLPAAKAAFARDPSVMDDRYDRDLAAWSATLATPAPPEPTGGA